MIDSTVYLSNFTIRGIFLKKPIYLLVILFVLFNLSACSDDDTTGTGGGDTGTAKWTIIYYCDADNDLEQFLMADLNEMETVDLSGTGVQIIALVDRHPNYWDGDGNWTDTRAYKVGFESTTINDTLGSATTRIAVPELGITTTGTTEQGMDKPDTLQKFIAFCKANYPADKYMLVMSDHGGGWRSDSKSAAKRITAMGVTKQICWDETSGGYEAALNMSDVRTAIAGGMGGDKLDVVAMDACLMGTVEVAYELRNVADILVASSQTEPGFGYPYNQILNAIKSGNGDQTPAQMGTLIADQYYAAYNDGTHIEASQFNDSTGGASQDTTQSVYDLSKITALASAIDSLGTAMNGNYNNLDTRLASHSFTANEGPNVDIYDFCNKLIDVSLFTTQAQAVKTAVDNAVITHTKGTQHTDSYGFALYFPLVADAVNSAYTATTLQFLTDYPNWAAMLNSITSPTSSDPLETAHASGSTTVGNNSPQAAYDNRTAGTQLTTTAQSSYLTDLNDVDCWYIPVAQNSAVSFTIYLENIPATHDYDLLLFGVYNGTVYAYDQLPNDNAGEPYWYAWDGNAGVNETLAYTASSGTANNGTWDGFVVLISAYADNTSGTFSSSDTYSIRYAQ